MDIPQFQSVIIKRTRRKPQMIKMFWQGFVFWEKATLVSDVDSVSKTFVFVGVGRDDLGFVGVDDVKAVVHGCDG